MSKTEEIDELILGAKPVAKEITGCALQAIRGAAVTLGSNDAYNSRGREEFDRLCKAGHNSGDGYYKGKYITATIVSIADKRASYQPVSVYDGAVKALKARGFKLLGTFPGAHPDNFGPYDMELWGLGFTLPTEAK